MGTQDPTTEIIDRIYDVAVDPERYEAMLDVWERHLSVLRREAEAGARAHIANDAAMQAHVDRAGIFLQRLYETKGTTEGSLIDKDVKAAFLVGSGLSIDQANRAAADVLGVRSGDELDRLTLAPEDITSLRTALRRTMAAEGTESLLLRFVSAASHRPIVFHLARRVMAGQATTVLVRTTEVGWPEHLSQTIRDAFALTRAEVDIVRALAEGSSVREISSSSKRSTETIKSHLASILAKTGTRSQAELIRITLGLMDVVGATAQAENSFSVSQHLTPIAPKTMRMPDGRRFDWIEFGRPGGRPCLYLPIDYGLVRWPRAAELAAFRSNLRVITPVRAGYGNSSPQPRTVKNYAEATGADLQRLLDHLGVARCAVLALGADFRFALALAALAPTRVTGIYGCSAALPVMTAAQYDRMGKWHRFILANARYAPQILPFLVKAGFALARRIGSERFFRSVHADSAADMRTFSTPEVREAVLLGSEVCLGATHSAHEAFARECIDSEIDWSHLVHGCTVPVRLLQGAEDQQTPAATIRELMTLFPALDIEIMEDAGTLIFFQHWPRVLQELERMLPEKTT